ncbi:MAG: ECF transporter S component [Turicibacter sp.]|nr:ECF transporter S component [Turicibacter sp.]
MKTFSDTRRTVLLAILLAMGAILMLVEIPYPPVPWLMFDISDLPIILAFETLGFGAALLASLIKSLINFLMKGMAGPLAIGQITALVSSMVLSLLYVAFRKGQGKHPAVAIISTMILYSAFLTFCNWLFITPIYFGGLWFRDVMEWASFDSFIEGSHFHFGYTATILIVYFPFNLLKSGIVLALYELVEPRLLPQLRKALHYRD